MEQTIESLGRKRDKLFTELLEVGDFRRGTISVSFRKCGKKNCICAKKGHPGHGPQYLWSTTRKGKSYSKNLKIGPELLKYKSEIFCYQEFLKLSDEIVQLNEKICNLRPIQTIENKTELEELKKKLRNLYKKKYKGK